MKKYVCDNCGREVVEGDYYELQLVQKIGDSVQLIDDDIVGICGDCTEIVTEHIKKTKVPIVG